MISKGQFERVCTVSVKLTSSHPLLDVKYKVHEDVNVLSCQVSQLESNTA